MGSELITGAEILIRSLIDEGVTTVFGYPGGAIMPVYDKLYDYQGKQINHILVRHEQAAAHAAEGYARVSGKVGVAIATSGPGATNTITGIADAMMDSTPMVVITGQVGVGALGTDAFQECDVVDIAQPISKWAYQIRSAEKVAWAVSRAFYIARSGRPGPVVLDFTKNAQTELAEYEKRNINFIRRKDHNTSFSDFFCLGCFRKCNCIGSIRILYNCIICDIFQFFFPLNRSCFCRRIQQIYPKNSQHPCCQNQTGNSDKIPKNLSSDICSHIHPCQVKFIKSALEIFHT